MLMICVFCFVDFKYYNNNANDCTEQENENNTYAEMTTSAYSVLYDEDGQYLLSPEGDKIAGPFLKVYSEDVSADILYCRYVDKTTELIGYIKKEDGNKMTDPIFTEASQMDTVPARVKEITGRVYYINNSFLRISNDFLEGSEFEHQGCYARVKLLET